MKKRSLIASLLLLALAPSSHAAKFANQFAEFELPPQWQCSLEGAEWVCQSTIEAKKREAMIILAAKLKGQQDGLEQYEGHLKQPKSYNSVQGKPITSEMKYTKFAPVNNHTWVDSLHLQSELPDFYTRYLATVKEDIGVLVTFSVHKLKYNDYANDIENMIKTLKVFRKPGGINVRPASDNLFAITPPAGISEQTVFPVGGDSEAPKKPKEDDNTLLIALGAGAILFFLWKRRQNADRD